jgi:PPOX class probable F420-dependent enzyme
MTEPPDLLASVRQYLAAPRCAVLSTIGQRGFPHQAVVHYMPTPDGVLVNGDADRRWVRNLKRDPRASIVVHDAANPLHWVGIRGDVVTTRDGRDAAGDAMAMARRYDEDPADYEQRERLSLLIRPQRVFEYGS